MIFELGVKVAPKVRIDLTHLNREAALLADRVAASATNEVKLAIVSFGAIATGETLRNTRWRSIGDRPQAVFGVASTGTFRRQVVSPRALRFIISGRKAGKKMPVRMVGTGVRGGKLFEPLPALLKWFTALNIPRTAWFPILRAISRRGIPPKNVPARAARNVMPAVRSMAGLSAVAIARGLVKYAG